MQSRESQSFHVGKPTANDIGVLFGKGSADEDVAAEIASLGASRAMVISPEPERDLAESVTSRIAPHFVVGPGGPPCPCGGRRSGMRAHGDKDADVVVSVGGGSTTGLAPAIALTAGLRVIAVPVSHAGSEASDVRGNDRRRHQDRRVSSRVLPVKR